MRGRPWWQGRVPVISAIAAVVVVIAVFVYLANRPQSNAPAIGSPVPATVLQQVTGVSPSVFKTVGTGGTTNPFIALPASAHARTSLSTAGKPTFLYVGGDFCPFCAAERWSIVVALSRFGTVKGLELMESSSADQFANTNTFTFAHASYTSSYLDFSGVEIYDRSQKPYQTLTTQQNDVYQKYDTPTYISSLTAQEAGSIPFLYIAGKYVSSGASYSPQVLAGLSWQQIAARLKNPSDPVTKNIVGIANYMTAAICQATGNQPTSVCAAPPIPQIEPQLPKSQG